MVLSVPHSPAAALPARDKFRPALGSWQAFHQQWWGAAGSTRLRAAQECGSLRIEQADVCKELQFLDQTAGRVHLLDKLNAIYAAILASQSGGGEGMVYMGPPGSGRSFLLFYILLCRMAAAEAFHYTTSDGVTYRFDETGVAVAQSRPLNEFDILWVESGPVPWSLVDSTLDGSAPRCILTLGSLYIVHMTGFQKSEFKWSSGRPSQRRLLEPWTCAEILECLPVCSDFRGLPRTVQASYGNMTEPDVAAIVDRSGPFLHDVVREIAHPGRAAADIATHLQPVSTAREFLRLLGDLYLNVDPLFDALFVRRRDPRAAELKGVDYYVVQFKSRLAAAAFVAHMRVIGVERVKDAMKEYYIHPRNTLGVWTSRLFALEESFDDDHWQISVGLLDGFNLTGIPA